MLNLLRDLKGYCFFDYNVEAETPQAGTRVEIFLRRLLRQPCGSKFSVEIFPKTENGFVEKGPVFCKASPGTNYVNLRHQRVKMK